MENGDNDGGKRGQETGEVGKLAGESGPKKNRTTTCLPNFMA
jgi:hypothetical protein